MTRDNRNRTLDRLKAGERGIIESITSKNRSLTKKLLSMGLVAGTLIEVSRIAPLGDPMKVRCKGYDLSLRMAEARDVKILPFV